METPSLPVTTTFPTPPLVIASRGAEIAPWADPTTTNVDHLLSGATRDKILAMTNRIFSGPATCRVDEDPEYPGYKYPVIEVQVLGDAADIVAKEIEWHRQITSHFPELSSLRLSLSAP